MKTMYVYIVECNDGIYYTGVTNNADKRLIEHNEGIDSSSYTYSRRPVRMVFCERFNDPEQAIAFEKRLKGWSRAKKKAIIDGAWEKLPELSRREKSSTGSD